MIMMHRETLVKQFHESLVKFGAVVDGGIGIACAGLSNRADFEKRVCIGTYQTIRARKHEIRYKIRPYYNR